MKFFEVKDGKKVVSDHLQDPKDLTRDDWTQLFMELGFEVENKMELKKWDGFLDNYFHSQDYDLQLEHLYKGVETDEPMGTHGIWAVKSKKRGRVKNRDLIKKHSIIIRHDMNTEESKKALVDLLETIREQYL